MALQPDIKRLLEQAGGKDYIKEIFNFLKKDNTSILIFSDKTIDALVDACSEMQSTKTGALIVIELDTPLDNITTTGLKIDAIVQKAILVQSFVKNTPLHDGAMVIKGNRIDSATCYLPLQNNSKISKELGTRHRAGIGVTEEVNCFVIIVSEETGAISWAENGKLRHKVSLKELKQKLISIQHSKDQAYIKNKNQSKKLQSKIKIFVEKKIGHNIKEKALQCLCAILIWLAVINFLNPVTTRRVQDIPVQIVNQSVLTNTDKTFDILKGDKVQIILEGRRKILDDLDIQKIKATADFNDLSITYSVPINIEIPEEQAENIQVIYKQDDNMRITIDDIAEVLLDVGVNIVGNAAENKYISDIKLNNQQIKISGPSKLIQTIDKVEIDVNVEDAYENFQTTQIPKVYDKNGQLISQDRITLSSNSIKQNIQVLDTKQIKLNVSIINKANDIKIDSYEISSDNIKIAGTDQYLKNINELNIEVDVTNTLQKSEQQKIVEVVDLSNYIDSNIQIYGDSKINVQMQVQKVIEKTFEIQSQSLDILNMSNKYSYNISEPTVEITLKGYKDILDQISSDKIKAYIDVYEYQQGKYETDIMVDLDKQQNLDVTGNPKAHLIVTKKEGS